MKEVRLNGHTVDLYSSIEELPMVRFHKYNKCLLVDAGVGSDLSAFDGHIERVVRYISSDKREEAAKELENLRQNIYIILQGMSPNHMAFACLVARIDGKVQDDISDEGLQRVMQQLGGAPLKDITANAEAVKKKIDEELVLYFPDNFDSAEEKEYYDLMKRRTQVKLDVMLNGDSEQKEKEIERLTNDLVLFTKPKKFTGSDSFEIEHDKRFEDMCLLISQNLHTDAKKMTTLEYYNAYKFLQKQNKRQKRQNKAL